MWVWVPYDPDLAAIGAIEPVFVEEFDYHATKRVVLDGNIEATWISEMDNHFPVQALTRYEDCDINVYKTVLKWRSTISDVPQPGKPTLNLLESHARAGLPLRNEWR